jgi:protein-disulfide isomerase
LDSKPFALVGVHIGGLNAKKLKEVMEREKLAWRSFVDPGNAGAGPIAQKWRVSATPTFYVIDHNGVVCAKWTGAPEQKTLDATLDKLIRLAEKKD